jgi:hypothetical protein
MYWFHGRTTLYLWQFWQLPMTWITLLAGLDRLLSKARDKPNDEPNDGDL